MKKTRVKSVSIEDVAKDVARIATAVSGKTIPSYRDDLSTLGIDSLTMLDLLTALEEHFNILLSENIIKEFRSIERIARIVRDTAASDPI